MKSTASETAVTVPYTCTFPFWSLEPIALIPFTKLPIKTAIPSTTLQIGEAHERFLS